MCLVVAVHVPYERRSELAAATPPSPDDRITVYFPGDYRMFARWRGLPKECVAEFVPDESGCGCGFVSTEAGSDPSVWNMTPEMAHRLANALQTFIGSMPDRVSLSAMWSGDRAKVEQAVSLTELVDLARRSRLGIRTMYQVSPSRVGAR